MIHTTPSLEDRAKAVGLYDSRLIDWVIRVEEVIKQRDELLAACQKAAHYDWPYIDEMRIAIARVKESL